MIKIITKKLALLSIILLLSNCSTYKGSFSCKANKGRGCESVSKVNELVNDGKLTEFKYNINKKTNKSKKKCSCEYSSKKNEEKAAKEGNAKNSPEKVTIHFNEYKEKDTTYKPSEIEVGIK